MLNLDQGRLSTHYGHTHSPGAAVQRNNLGLLRRVSRPPRTACDHPLLNHLIRAQQQRLRDGEAKRLGRLEIYHQFQFRWLQDR
jgi:hypothetical protein